MQLCSNFRKKNKCSAVFDDKLSDKYPGLRYLITAERGRYVRTIAALQEFFRPLRHHFNRDGKWYRR